ncbi:ATP-binding protein [Thermomonospora amylolytica]|uniref:ATP-binding protein n=1 Tax=Thermomonospora amylolytica TaxID=1411117 RepID=UPI000E6D2A19|nr:ATP-binding protein [Thermomonospora amylolytica]
MNRSLFLRLSPLAEEAGQARRIIAATCAAWGCPPDLVADLTLLAAELIGNAVLHGPRSEIEVELHNRGAVMLVEVTDTAEAIPVPVEPAPEQESGRGLFIVQALATVWDWRRNPCGTKTVWSAVLLPDGSMTELVEFVRERGSGCCAHPARERVLAADAGRLATCRPTAPSRAFDHGADAAPDAMPGARPDDGDLT